MLIDLTRLKIHPLAVSLIPRMTELEYLSFLDDIKKNGIIDPIEVIPDKKIDGLFLIVDGVNRYTAAKELNFKKVPVEIKNISEEKIKDYILSKSIMRRNISKTQRAVLAVEWIFSNDFLSDDLFRQASRKFAVSESIITAVSEIKNSYPEIYKFLRNGSLDYKNAVELIKSYNKKEYPLIEEFKNLSEDLKNALKKVPVSVQQIIYNKLLTQNKIKYNEIKDFIESKTEENFLIQELTNQYHEQKEKNRQIEKKYREVLKEKNKLSRLVNDLNYLIKDLYEKQKLEFSIDSSNKIEILELLSEINKIKEQINHIDNIKLKENNRIDEENIKVISEIYALFTFFSSVFSDYNISKLYKLFQEIECLNLTCVKQIEFFFSQLKKFLDLIQNELNKNINHYSDNSNHDRKFLILHPLK